MIIFPVSDRALFCVIEPGNVRRMKEGRPLKISLPNGSRVGVAFTPDANRFLVELGVHTRMPDASGRIAFERARVTTDQLEAALKRCRGLAEVER